MKTITYGSYILYGPEPSQWNSPQFVFLIMKTLIDWAENRSKKLHYPLVTLKVNIEKLKKDHPSSSKAQVVKFETN